MAKQGRQRPRRWPEQEGCCLIPQGKPRIKTPDSGDRETIEAQARIEEGQEKKIILQPNERHEGQTHIKQDSQRPGFKNK